MTLDLAPPKGEIERLRAERDALSVPQLTEADVRRIVREELARTA